MSCRSALLLAMVVLPGVGCVSALHAPTEVDALISERTADLPADAESLLDQADAAFAERTLDAARRAVDLSLRAAVVEGHRVDGALAAARAGIWIAGHADQAGDRERASADAVRAAQLCGKTSPEDVRCDYWLALALGVQARERRATALDALPRIVQLLDSVVAREPAMEYAGAHRTLALLYLRAPGWPTGPGDPDLGVSHARRAVALAPEYPPNQMGLAEGLGAIGDSEGSDRAYRKASFLAGQWRDRGEPDAGEWLERSESRAGLR